MASEIKQLLEESIAQGNDSWFGGAKLNNVATTNPQRKESGLSVRFKDGKTFSIIIKLMDDAVGVTNC